MSLRFFLIAWGLLGVTVFPAIAAERPPNVLFIFTDDQSFETIRGALAQDRYRYPHLDRLVNGGTAFTHCYNMGGWGGARSASPAARCSFPDGHCGVPTSTIRSPIRIARLVAFGRN